MRKLIESLQHRPGFLVPQSRYRDCAIFALEYAHLAKLTSVDDEEYEDEDEDEEDVIARANYYDDGYNKVRAEMRKRNMLAPRITSKEGRKNFIYHPRKYVFTCGCTAYFPRICKDIILQKGVLCSSPIKAQYCPTHYATATGFEDGYENVRMQLLDNQPKERDPDDIDDDDDRDIYGPDYAVLKGEKVLHSTTHGFHWVEISDLVDIARGMVGDINSTRNIEACNKYLQSPPKNFMETRPQSLTQWGQVPRVIIAVPRSIFDGVIAYRTVSKQETEDFEKALNRMLGIVTLKPRIRIETPRFIIRRKKTGL